MSTAQSILLNVPSVLLCIGVVGGTVLFSVVGVLVVRHFVHHTKLKTHHDVADPILGALGAVYSILLAFVVVTVWQDFDKANMNVEAEANYLADLYRDAEAFAPDFQAKVGVLLRQYRSEVVNDEWKTMAKGEMSPKVEKLMRKVWTLYTTYQPRNSTEQSFFDESVRKLNLFREMRRQRLMDSRTGIPSLLWFTLIVEGFIAISFTFLFGTENFKAQIIMGGLLAVTISLILFTILSFDFPFTGNTSISSEPFVRLLLD
ncbi:MAG: DUF4239 domain-containing protein [Candidatus Omnitrophica bacterium]|nr:DUF4239 domain-containing protein [Candidatus Omnitrophota bacterium]